MKRAAVLLIVVAVIAILGYLQRDSIVTGLAMRGIEAGMGADYLATASHTVRRRQAS